MQQTLENFFRALRSMDVRISPAEAIDAHETVDTVGYGDREFLKDALCVALAKSEEEVGSFEECFDMFFTREEFQDRRDNDSPDDDEANDSALSEGDRDLIGDQELAQLVLDETGLLPHANTGAMSAEELTLLRPVSPAKG